MKKIIIASLSALLILSLTAACGKKADETADVSSEAVSQAPTVSGVTESNTSSVNSAVISPKATSSVLEPTFVIPTEHVDIQYPEKWAGTVSVKTEKDSVKFYAGKVHLFDILFDGEGGIVLGTIIGEGKNTLVRVVYYDIPENVDDRDKYFAMQEDINVIIDYLNLNYNFAFGEITGRDYYVFKIPTSVTTLYYPAFWNGVVTIENDSKSVRFSYEGTKLFDVLFNSDSGFLIGSYKDTKISVITYEINRGRYSGEDYERLCTMQEDVNVILQHLNEDPDFMKKTVVK